MNVRIQGNSIRYRLKRFEVEAFQQTHSVLEDAVFGEGAPARLQFALRTTAVSEMEVNYQPGRVTTGIPQRLTEEWTRTELVGFANEVRLKSGAHMKVLVEKDFNCLDKPETEDAASYLNPKETC